MGWLLNDEEIRDLYRLLTVVGLVEYRKLRWAGYVDRKVIKYLGIVRFLQISYCCWISEI